MRYLFIIALLCGSMFVTGCISNNDAIDTVNKNVGTVIHNQESMNQNMQIIVDNQKNIVENMKIMQKNIIANCNKSEGKK